MNTKNVLFDKVCARAVVSKAAAELRRRRIGWVARRTSVCKTSISARIYHPVHHHHASVYRTALSNGRLCTQDCGTIAHSPLGKKKGK